MVLTSSSITFFNHFFGLLGLLCIMNHDHFFLVVVFFFFAPLFFFNLLVYVFFILFLEHNWFVFAPTSFKDL